MPNKKTPKPVPTPPTPTREHIFAQCKMYEPHKHYLLVPDHKSRDRCLITMRDNVYPPPSDDAKVEDVVGQWIQYHEDDVVREKSTGKKQPQNRLMRCWMLPALPKPPDGIQLRIISRRNNQKGREAVAHEVRVKPLKTEKMTADEIRAESVGGGFRSNRV